MISDGKGVHVGGEEAVAAGDVSNLHPPLGKTPPPITFPFLEFGDGVAWSSQAEPKTKCEHVALPIPMWVCSLTDQPFPSHVLLAQGRQVLGVDLVHEWRLVVSVQSTVKGINSDHRVVRHDLASGKSPESGF